MKNRPKNNIVLILIAVLFSTSVFAFANNNANNCENNETKITKNIQFYPADLEEGSIGYTIDKPIDKPDDNVFQVNLDRLPDENSIVWLTYELHGVQDHTGISRSINDEHALGGYLVKKSDQWQAQREQINASWLKMGDNNIRFALPEHANYNYKVRNLGIVIEKNNDNLSVPISDIHDIIINQPENLNYYSDQGYLKGFIMGKDGDKAKLYIDGKEINTISSAFELMVEKPDVETSTWEVSLLARYPDGTNFRKVITFGKEETADFVNNIAEFKSIKKEKWLGFKEAEFQFKNTQLHFPAGAISKPSAVSITALRNVDIVAMNQGMVNLTQDYSGYRFLPHPIQFEKDVEVSIGYDESKIPNGYTVDDIRTYFFDESVKRWMPLERVKVDKENKKIISKTNHFTDMINGIIKVPESPETSGYTPTSIKDIKAADPSAAVVTIEPPSANQNGSASLGYPIKLPAGRQGIQPQLGLQYNSEGGNGWTGLGWDLSIPSISIETRWGVPRYNAALETETYSMSGMQLNPVAHRATPVARTTEKQFHPRVEGSFNKIIRHGDNPTNYWWEVTDKTGVRHFYGGTPSGGIENNSVLKDANGNIGYWALVETRDLNENFARYHCTIVQDVGINGGSNVGQNIYIDKITYTGHETTEGKYTVIFTRDRQLGETKRTDVSITGRLGFKQVTADLLRTIEVQFDGQNVRSYKLNYTEGAFFKTLLESVSEFDVNGNLFNTHDFEYYDDVRVDGDYVPLAGEEEWTPQSDGVEGNFVSDLLPFSIFSDKASALSGNRSSGGGGALAVTAGINDGELWAKSKTVGASFGFSSSKNEGMLALVDINGDGLADKVYKGEDGLRYRPNQSGPNGTTIFGTSKPIVGVSNFSKGKSTTTDFGLESHFGIFAGLQYSRTKSTTSVYFSDVNGDQLIDIVKDGTVYFNHIGLNGDPIFTTSSGDTPSPIDAGSSIDPNLVQIDPAELEEAIDQSPLHDVVRVWEAPYDGMIAITEAVSLIEDTSPDGIDYTADDGVRAAIQHNALELWAVDISAGDFSSKTPTGVSAINVFKGDKIYFRLQSVFDGAYDQVDWSPTITYSQNTAGLIDPNGLPVYQFNAGDDFLITADMSTGMAIDGDIHIEGDFTKPITSDDITVEIVKESNGTATSVWQQNYTWNQTAIETIDIDLSVFQGDNIFFRVSSETNIDWTSLEWNPYIYFTASNDPNITQVYDNNNNPVLDFYPVVDFQSYNQSLSPSLYWEATNTESISVLAQPVLVANTETDELVFVVKKENELVDKQIIQVTNGVLGAITPITIMANQGDKFYFEYYTKNIVLAEAITTPEVAITATAIAVFIAGLHTDIEEGGLFGPQYRHWGQFAYNGNRDRATMPIIESDLVLDNSITNPPQIDLSTATDGDDMQNMYDAGGGNNPSDTKFIYMIPENETQCWRGYDDLTYVKKEIVSSSRMGEDDILPINPIANGGTVTGDGAMGINKVSKTDNFTFSIGAGPAGFSKGIGTTKQLYDYVDMNGDRHPDIVSEDKIQYTLPYGGLEPTATSHNFGKVMESSHEVTGFSLGGTFIKSKAESSMETPKGRKASNSEDRALISAGISGNFGLNEDEVDFAWMDINGDGLPDRVYGGGMVELNIGYDFLPAEQWGYVGLSDGSSTNIGGGLSINIKNYSISVGVGLSRSENETEEILEDVNGDGLLDYIVRAPQLNPFLPPSPLKVALNTGNGFALPIEWTDASEVNKSVSTGESVNGTFTICFTVLAAKICVNPTINASQGANRTQVQIRDIDGDGYPDYLRSDEDNELKVQRSTIKRTNKLKSVERPLGADFAVDYKRIGNTYEMPNNVWALASVEINDGLVGDGVDRLLNTFEYEDGYYDRHERDFYGFKTVKSIQHDTENNDAPYRAVVQEFINDNYYERGLVEKEFLQDAAQNKYTETVNTYELKDIATGTPLPATYTQTDDGLAFPAVVETEKLFYEGQATPGKSTQMTYDYDLYGNIAGYTDFGDIGTSDDYSSNINYHNIATNYIVGVPSSIEVTSAGTTYRKKETSIDNSTGNITEIRSFLETGPVTTHNMIYDTYGNIETMTRPENALGQRLSFTYEYDPEVQTYTTGVSDSYGYSSSSSYDYRFGQMLNNIDLNGQEMKYTIDDLGRISTITGPLEIAAGVPFTIEFEYHPDAAIPWAATRHYDPAHPANFLETNTFIDGLKRAVQVKKDIAIHAGPQLADLEKTVVSGRVTFDAFGRVTEAYYPIEEVKQNEDEIAFTPTYDNITSTKTTYDVLDRNLTTTLPDLAVTSMQYGFGNDRNGANQFKTRVTDANGIWKESFTNVRGLQTSAKEQHSQGTDVWTSFFYNPINELTQVNDDHDNIIQYTYDWLGRKMTYLHPDAGLTSFKYDPASNLTEKMTANLQSGGVGINYVYDHERLTNIIYPENLQNNVAYEYGAFGAANNGAGRIIRQQDATGVQDFFYNPLGATVKNTRVVVVPGSTPLSYTTEWTYDTWNRITSMLYPDGESLTYNYNVGGTLHSMSGEKDGTAYNYLTQLGYDKFEQRVYLSYGNGTETTYAYEPERRRLQNMVAETASGRKMMDNTYTYDNVTNILSLVNNAPVPSNNLMGGPSNYSYTYDDLYRLTDATGEFSGSSRDHRYLLAMEYNNVHSILSKDQVHERKSSNGSNWVSENQTTYDFTYEYDDANQPHAPIQIGENSYTYDLNGNQTGWTSNVNGQNREIFWDEENRIKAISDNGQIFNYTYDAGGERVLKSSGGGQTVGINGNPAGGNGGIGNTTVYVNPYVVIRSGGFTKHFFIESQRIVSKLGENSDGLLQDGITIPPDVLDDLENIQSNARTTIDDIYDEMDMARIDWTVGNSGIIPPGQIDNENSNAIGNGNGGNGNGNGNNGNGGTNGNGDGNNGNGDGTNGNNGGGNGNGGNNGGDNGNGGNNGGDNGNGGNNGGDNGNGGNNGNGNNQEAFIFYYHPDHLGSSSYITDAEGEVYQHVEYFAFGETFIEEHSNTNRTPYLYNGKELDEETGLYYYGARYYDAKTSVWASVDPLAYKYPNWSPYVFTMNNPINLVDPDGREPIKPYVGTVATFMSVLNNSPSKVGRYKGAKASDYLSKLGNTKWSWKQMRPLPTQTGYFNMKKGRYIYTKKGGWIDMTHFLFYAGKAYKYKQDGVKNPIGESVQSGYLQESSDALVAKHSAYSYEDLPSDKFGADFAVNHFDQESDLTFGEQLKNYLDNQLGATTPESAPNYKKLPKTDNQKTPTRQNVTTQPVYVKGDDGTIGRPAKPKPSGIYTCFVPGTKVIMFSGKEKNIEDIAEGDEIMSVNMKTMELEKDLVLELPRIVKKYRLINMQLNDGTVMKFSPAHPFWVVGKGWSVYDQKEARAELTFEVNEINVGDTLLKNVNGKLKEVIISSIMETGDVVEMYNVEHVEKNNNFFANKILVHNKRLNQDNINGN